jgi:LysR family hydrogen peroxide-inducible transcriptional activator
MVANGMGLTLLPEISVGFETMHSKIRIMRFREPEPKRTLGLAWRITSPRKRDFVEFGKLVVECVGLSRDRMPIPLTKSL